MNASADTVDTPLGRLPQAAVAAWLMLVMGAAMLASVPADLQAQALLSGVGLGLIIAFSHRATENPNDWRRSGVLVFGMFLSFRYMVWRTCELRSYLFNECKCRTYSWYAPRWLDPADARHASDAPRWPYPASARNTSHATRWLYPADAGNTPRSSEQVI